MGRNRYRVLEVSGIGSISRYRYRRKIRYRYRVLFDTISILFRYFTCTFTIRLSYNWVSLYGMISKKIDGFTLEVQRILMMLTAKTPILKTITSFHEYWLLKLYSNGKNAWEPWKVVKQFYMCHCNYEIQSHT